MHQKAYYEVKIAPQNIIITATAWNGQISGDLVSSLSLPYAS